MRRMNAKIAALVRNIKLRYGKKALVGVLVLWLTKWVLTLVFGAQIIGWLKDVF